LFYVSPSDLEVSSCQPCNYPYFPQFPGPELAFDLSLLPPLIPSYGEPMLDDNADSFSFTEREMELSKLPADSPAATDFDVPQSRDTSIPSQPNQSGGISSPYTQESNTAIALVCYDCRDRPSFEHRHQYKRHRKRHDRPCKCDIDECRLAFAFNRDLQRHIVSVHPNNPQATSQGQYYCHHPGCARGRTGHRGGFPRKDTLGRHLKTHRTRNQTGKDTQ